LQAVGDRLVGDQWDSATGATGLAEISLGGSVKSLLTEKALIFAVGSTRDQILAVRQSGDAPAELLALNPAKPEAKATLVTQLNPPLQGLALGKLEQIGTHVLLRPTVPPPTAAGHPVVVFAYPNAKPEETPLAYETAFENLPRRLALRGIASLFAHVTVTTTDKPDSDLSQELVDGTLRAVDAAVATGGLDGKRLGFVGWSYGGYMAYCLATGTDRFSALVSGAGYLDPLLSYVGQGDQAMVLGDQTTQGGLGGPPWKFQERYLKTGPLWRLEKITAPILIVVGSDDKRVPPSESEQAFRLLRRANKAAVLAVYPGGTHSLKRWPAEQQIALANRLETWFQKTLVNVK
jgi:dipeptidyl aminopeptidase/acylaminoacyl peptidase